MRPGPAAALPIAAGQPPPFVRALVSGGGAVALVGVLLVLFVPVLDVSSEDCAPLSCALLQVIGKVAAAGGVAVAASALAVGSAVARRPAGAVLAALIALPALIWPFSVVDAYGKRQAGIDQPSLVVAAAREYAVSSGECGGGEPRATVINGRQDWVTVRATWPDGCARLILLKREAGAWQAKAIASAFTRDELRALGAPTNVARDAQ